jgi:para-aminobenzoate synthetase component 1
MPEKVQLHNWRLVIDLPDWGGYVSVWRPNDSEHCLLALGAEEVIASDDLKRLDEIQNSGEWWFGYLSYDLKNKIEKLDSEKPHPMGFSGFSFFKPKVVLRLDEDCWQIEKDTTDGFWRGSIVDTEPWIPKPQKIYWRPDQSKEDYLKAVNALKHHIQLGDIYEVNYCTSFSCEKRLEDNFTLFEHINDKTEAPFSAYMKQGRHEILCGSPERYILKEGSHLSSYPIKGTIRRSANETEDWTLRETLRTDKKEQAENVMIVDLVRNDLSKIAIKNSVKVDELFGVYSFKTVHHMISAVSCELKEGVGLTEIVKATFPMGSMTGAPKIRAMQLADKYELNARGIYSGSIGVVFPNGDFDFNVVIRTMTYDSELLLIRCNVGGAITALCDAEKEYEECLLKANALLSIGK